MNNNTTPKTDKELTNLALAIAHDVSSGHLDAAILRLYPKPSGNVGPLTLPPHILALPTPRTTKLLDEVINLANEAKIDYPKAYEKVCLALFESEREQLYMTEVMEKLFRLLDCSEARYALVLNRDEEYDEALTAYNKLKEEMK